MSFEEAVLSLARNGPEILRPTFSDLVREIRIGGFEEGIRRAREQLADPVFDTVGATLVMSHRVGGRNLSTVLGGINNTASGQVATASGARTCAGGES